MPAVWRTTTTRSCQQKVQDDWRHGLKRRQPPRLPTIPERSCFPYSAYPVSSGWFVQQDVSQVIACKKFFCSNAYYFQGCCESFIRRCARDEGCHRYSVHPPVRPSSRRRPVCWAFLLPVRCPPRLLSQKVAVDPVWITPLPVPITVAVTERR